MSCPFNFFCLDILAVFWTNQEDERMIMKGCVQQSPIYRTRILPQAKFEPEDPYISRTVLNPLNYGALAIILPSILCF